MQVGAVCMEYRDECILALWICEENPLHVDRFKGVSAGRFHADRGMEVGRAITYLPG